MSHSKTSLEHVKPALIDRAPSAPAKAVVTSKLLASAAIIRPAEMCQQGCLRIEQAFCSMTENTLSKASLLSTHRLAGRASRIAAAWRVRSPSLCCWSASGPCHRPLPPLVLLRAQETGIQSHSTPHRLQRWFQGMDMFVGCYRQHMDAAAVNQGLTTGSTNADMFTCGNAPTRRRNMMTRVAEKAAAAPVKPKNLISTRFTPMFATAVMPVAIAGGHMMHCACSACR